MKPSPWLSLCLLAGAYATFSWFLHHAFPGLCNAELLRSSTIEKEFLRYLVCDRGSWLVWLILIGFALSQALLLTTFSIGFREFINRWLGSDIGYFSIITLSVISLAFILLWLHVFTYILVTISAEILARLELQNAGFNRWQSLGVLALTSFIGLAMGWGVWYVRLAEMA